MHASEKPVSGEEPAFGIIRFPGENADCVAAFEQPKCQIVDAKVLGPEVLGDDQDIQAANSLSVPQPGKNLEITFTGEIPEEVLADEFTVFFSHGMQAGYATQHFE